MTKNVLYGIGLPLHGPLPHAVWMMPQMGVLYDGVCQAPNRYNINQTTGISSLTTLIKECFECTCIYVFRLQYMYNNIVPCICMYPLYWTGVLCGLILVHQLGEGVIQVWEWHDPAMFMYVIHGTYILLSPKSPRVHSGSASRCKCHRVHSEIQKIKWSVKLPHLLRGLPYCRIAANLFCSICKYGQGHLPVCHQL